MLASLAAQTVIPHQIIVVDGSELPVDGVTAEFSGLHLKYVRCFPPSLARQRNAGMLQLAHDITLAGYLDDDIVLANDATERMLQFWDEAGDDIGGAAFTITNNPEPGALRLKQMFGIDHALPGRVLRTGFASSITPQAHDIETEWLYGGATVWRRSVIQSYSYDEWFIGTGFMEDIDFSYTVGKRYRLFVVARAHLAHYSKPVRADRQRLLGKWQIVNRMHIVRKHRARGLSVLAAWYASFGLFLLNFAAAVVRRRRDPWNRSLGNAAGMISELFGRREQIGGHLK